jgi:hypothetical protein
MDATMQGALLRARKRRIARQILQSLTPWSGPGLSVTAGQYVSSENGTSAWLAATTGTTGSQAPTGQAVLFDDGGVSWTRADVQSLLKYQYSGAPTPA